MAKQKAAPKKTKEEESDFYGHVATKTGGGAFWKPTGGKDVIRLVPFKHEGKLHYGVSEFTHWNLDGSKKVFICPRTHGEQCPICALRKELKQGQWDKVKARHRVMVNVIVRDLDGEDRMVRGQLPPSVYGDIGAYVTGREGSEDEAAVTAIKDVLHPTKGRDFTVTTNGKSGIQRRYKVTPSKAPSPWGVDVNPTDLIEKLRPADDLTELADKLTER